MKRLILTICACVLLFAASSAWADWIDLPVKWGQSPALEAGFSPISNHPSDITRADDFMCYDPEPIVAVRWWGSYLGETEDRDEEYGFWKEMHISFHLSDDEYPPYGRPLNPELSLQTVMAQEFWTGSSDFMGAPVYQYNAYLVTPFNQQLGTKYFIDIDDPLEQTWCWHEAYYQQLDYHAWQSPSHTGLWTTDPEHVDLAFDLMIPEPATVCLLGLGGLALIRRKRKA